MRPNFSQVLAALTGTVLVLAGALGFLADGSFATAPIERGSFLGLDVNGWHNIVHVASGMLLLVGAMGRSSTRGAWRLFALAYLVVLIWGLVDGEDVFGLFPVDGADNALHALLLVVALVGARSAKEHRDIVLLGRVPVAAGEGPAVVGPGSGHVGGPRRNLARIDARLAARKRDFSA